MRTMKYLTHFSVCQPYHYILVPVIKVRRPGKGLRPGQVVRPGRVLSPCFGFGSLLEQETVLVDAN